MNRQTNEFDRDIEGFYTFIGASKKASERGDYGQAEKLLKSSLKTAEQHLIATEYTVKKIVEALIDVYEKQNKKEELKFLDARLKQLSGTDREDYLLQLKNVRC